MIYPIILAGGKGERFWPYSNKKHPKQLLPLASKKTMLEDTLNHIKKLRSSNPIHIIASKVLESPIKALIKNTKNIVLVGEPIGRDTAAAIGLACRLISAHDPKGVMVVMTADHSISPSSELIKAIKAASQLASSGNTLVTFGIRPSRPEVGYGYIETDAILDPVLGLDCRAVKQFHEKPSFELAKKYCKTRKHFWNSGMFAWRVDYLWSLFKEYLPDMYKVFESVGTLKASNGTFNTKLKKIYRSIEAQSIDYGIMEKAPDISLVIPNYSWDDIGSWTALDRLYKPDNNGNTIIGDAVNMNTTRTTCFSDSGLVATYGVRDLLIVQHNGVTLVIHKDKRPELKKLVSLVKQTKRFGKYL